MRYEVFWSCFTWMVFLRLFYIIQDKFQAHFGLFFCFVVLGAFRPFSLRPFGYSIIIQWRKPYRIIDRLLVHTAYLGITIPKEC
jgi:hypothetical protein